MAASNSTSHFWLSDFEFRRDGLFVRKTGQRINHSVLTLGEIWKWLGYYALVRSRGALRRLFNPAAARIWFAPEQPRPWYVIWAACTWAGLRFAASEAEADICFYFEDVTIGAPPMSGRTYANGKCWDISKSRVAKTFDAVAGYALSLDPLHFEGVAVEKGERNGAHDGRMVTCPMAPLPDKVYERFVDASDGETATDLRVSIVDRTPVSVLLKTKPAAKRFSIHNDAVRWVDLAAVFTSEELDLIARFCQEMQLDYGALDILRDRSDGRIYIVDVNKTDTGPAVDLNWTDRIKLTSVLANALVAARCEEAV